jgi:hypothetical protein
VVGEEELCREEEGCECWCWEEGWWLVISLRFVYDSRCFGLRFEGLTGMDFSLLERETRYRRTFVMIMTYTHHYRSLFEDL